MNSIQLHQLCAIAVTLESGAFRIFSVIQDKPLVIVKFCNGKLRKCKSKINLGNVNNTESFHKKKKNEYTSSRSNAEAISKSH